MGNFRLRLLALHKAIIYQTLLHHLATVALQAVSRVDWPIWTPPSTSLSLSLSMRPCICTPPNSALRTDSARSWLCYQRRHLSTLHLLCIPPSKQSLWSLAHCCCWVLLDHLGKFWNPLSHHPCSLHIYPSSINRHSLS